MKCIQSYVRQTKAATAIEYGLLAAGIALAIVVVVFGLGDVLYTLLWVKLPEAFNQ
jgi:Flp pilus assembly pilin Flp